MLAASSLILVTAFAASDLPSWTFDSPGETNPWRPNAHFAKVAFGNGVLAAEGTDWDPFFICTGLSFPTSPWQYLVIRIKADRAGSGELFFTGTEEGQYGGFSQDRSRRFHVSGGNVFCDVVVFPFWQAEGRIVKLRLDLYDGARFEIDSIAINDWGDARNPVAEKYAWNLQDEDAWRIANVNSDRFSPPLRLPIEDRGWATIELQSGRDTVGTLLWVVEGAAGIQSESFSIRGGEQPRAYNLELDGNDAWTGTLLALGVRLPDNSSVALRNVSIGEEPRGSAELAVTYFGFENGINRAGAPCDVLLRVSNLGGRVHGIRGVHFDTDAAVEVIAEPDRQSLEGLAHEEYADFTWTVRAASPGTYPIDVHFSGKGAIPKPTSVEVPFTESLGLEKADYVPEPRPIETEIEVAAYYFPGWSSPAKWDPVHRVAPIRKPVLGYYDESNPECVDWQIKWAVENGVSVFLVDWYWIKGNQHLTHWFEAYRESRYRDSLKVAIMWANHNPPRTHSREDWRNVTQEWIDHYFGMESYQGLLREARVFCEATGKKTIILGPINEWGEGSYIEPCTEYGFAMLEAVRLVFAKGDPASWPVNVAPCDIGRGPYDYPPIKPTTAWDFDDGDPGSWQAMMNVGAFHVEDGVLRLKALSRDPAMVVPLEGVNASQFGTAEVTMQVTGDLPPAMRAQLFWARGGSTTSETTSVSMPLRTDGGVHTYTFDLRANPRWRGTISMLRFDPSDASDVDVAIDTFRLR